MRRIKKSASVSSRNDDSDVEDNPAKRSRKDPGLRPFATVYFEELVAKAGLILSDGEDNPNHTLKCEPLTFLEDLKSILENNVDFPRNVDEFIKGFESCTEGDQLDTFLSTNVMITAEDNIETRIIQNSVMRLLLNLNCLQEHIVDYSLKRATQYSIDNKADKVQMLLKPFILLDNLTCETKLSKGLIDLLDVSEHNTRLEIITCLPDIVTQSEHQNVALELCRFMSEDYELTPAVLDCLSYFCLPSDLKMQVRDKMLTMLRTSAPLHLFPNMVNFFLIGCSSEHCIDIIHGLRDGLDWTSIGNQFNIDINTSQMMTTMALKNSLMKSKTLSTDWLKVITNVKETNDHKPLDLIILLIIYSLKNGKEKLVENMFRKKIKSSLFNPNFINLSLKKFKQIMKEYIFEILQIARSLLKSKIEPSFKDFSIHWLRCIFKDIPDVRRVIINELVNTEYIEEHDSLANSLIVLSKIGDDDIEVLKPFSLQILALINKIDILNSTEISTIMNLLCNLAFGIDNSVLQDDVHMLIRKQLSSSDLSIKGRGIAGGVMAIKHIVCSKVAQDEINNETEYSQIDDLPEGVSKDAASIVELIYKSTSKFTEMICYFYDELANMLSNCKNIDQPFLMWLTNNITNDFQNNFIIDIKDDNLKSINDIKITKQYCLNSIEDCEEQIVLNIANICLGLNPDNLDLRVLPSWFRVLQLLHKKSNNDDLSTIDALLGCAIIMPDITEGTTLDEYNPDHYESILNCYVHCINWFRELISAFSSQKDPSMRNKVLQRLYTLIKLEKQLCIYINASNIDYKPPICTFLGVNMKSAPILLKEIKPKKPKKGTKSKKKNSPNADNSALSMTLKTQELKSPDKASTSNKFKINTSFFRQLQFDCIDLFEEKLHIDDDNEESGVDLDSCLLLLDEIIPMLSAIFPSNKSKQIHPFSKPNKTIFISLNIDDAIERSLIFIPRLFEYMDSISKFIIKCLDSNDGIRDALSMFSELNIKAQLCLANIFNVFTLILSWSNFNLIENKQRLSTCFKNISCKYDPNNKIKSLKDHIVKFSIYMVKYKEWCILISTAAGLVKLFEILTNIVNDKDIQDRLIELSRDFLSSSWRDETGAIEKGLLYNQNVDTLLNGYFSMPDVEKIRILTEDLKVQCPGLINKNSTLDIFECINKTNFPLLFRSISRAVYEATKAQIERKLTDKQHLDLWRNIAIIMKNLTEILKIMDNRSNMGAFLKNSIPLFKLFSTQGMPMMDLKLKTEPDSVVEILRTLQHTTRFLHSLYCHLRLTKDTSLIAYLPQMKLTLETLVYKVKASLIVNNCSEAFWMGNLKNKNLQGELIPSQSTVAGESDEEDQLPEDENSDLEEDDENDDMKSVSSVF